MRAVVVERWTSPETLRVSEAPEPELRPGSVEVAVRAAGCNFFDILMAKGEYQVKPELPFIPGGELAGIVSRVGPEVAGWSVGDPVFGTTGMGCYAERVVLPVKGVHAMPQGMSFEQAAALPIVYPTSYAALVHRAKLERGETLLVHAAAGGVGIAAVQIGRWLGARVIATAGGAEKLEVARSVGAEVAIDYRSEDFVQRVLDETGGHGADVIYDPVGGDIFDRSLKCIAWNGRLLVIGFASGRIPEVKANRILLKNIAVVGLHWGATERHEPEQVVETFDSLARLCAEGHIEPLIFRSYPLEDVATALVALASRGTHGKVVLTP